MFMAHTISRCSAKIVQSVAPRVVGSNSARLIRSSAAKEDPTALSTDSYERGVLKNRLAGLGLLPFMDVSNPGPDPVRSLMQIQSDLESIARHFIANSGADPMSFNPFMQLMGTSSAEDEEPGPSSALLTTLRLPLDIEETETAYDITASVPGFNQDNINVTFCPDTHLLTMSGSIESKTPAAEEKVKGKEGKDKEVPVKRTQQQQKASFSRSIRLPARVNAEGIKAIVKNGLLTVSIPKPPAPEPAKTMAIKIEGA